MSNQRDIDKFFTVFDLVCSDTAGVNGNPSTRIMFLYNRLENKSEFNVLGKNLPEELDRRIHEWLKKNLNINNVLSALKETVINVAYLK